MVHGLEILSTLIKMIQMAAIAGRRGAIQKMAQIMTQKTDPGLIRASQMILTTTTPKIIQIQISTKPLTKPNRPLGLLNRLKP